MIFRTGSVLIVGMCEENILNHIYDFLTKLLKTEFENICQSIITAEQLSLKDKKKKVRRKTVMITNTTNEIMNASSNQVSTQEEIILKLKEQSEQVDAVQVKVKRSYKKKNKSENSIL
jgi:hypothetical protein